MTRYIIRADDLADLLRDTIMQYDRNRAQDPTYSLVATDESNAANAVRQKLEEVDFGRYGVERGDP